MIQSIHSRRILTEGRHTILAIIGVTKVYQVEDGAKAAAIELSEEENAMIEKLDDEAQVNLIRY